MPSDDGKPESRLAVLLGGASLPSKPPVDFRKSAIRRLRAALNGDDDEELADALKAANEAINESE